jgi:hypothetical protein
MEIRITKEGLPCFDEYSKYALEKLGMNRWEEIVIAHKSLCEQISKDKQ